MKNYGSQALEKYDHIIEETKKYVPFSRNKMIVLAVEDLISGYINPDTQEFDMKEFIFDMVQIETETKLKRRALNKIKWLE